MIEFFIKSVHDSSGPVTDAPDVAEATWRTAPIRPHRCAFPPRPTPKR